MRIPGEGSAAGVEDISSESGVGILIDVSGYSIALGPYTLLAREAPSCEQLKSQGAAEISRCRQYDVEAPPQRCQHLNSTSRPNASVDGRRTKCVTVASGAGATEWHAGHLAWMDPTSRVGRTLSI